MASTSHHFKTALERINQNCSRKEAQEAQKSVRIYARAVALSTSAPSVLKFIFRN